MDTSNLNTRDLLAIQVEDNSISYNYISGITAGTIVKNGAGTLYRININSIASNAAITLYDGTGVTSTIIYTTGAMVANTIPTFTEFGPNGIPFSVGLYVVKATAICATGIVFR